MREVNPAITLLAGFFYIVRDEQMLLVFSLRSSPGAELTARQVAVANGGGGHEHAAGFTLRLGVYIDWAKEAQRPSQTVALNNRSPIEIFKSALASASL